MLGFNLKQLEAFVAAAEYSSFTRAAEMLYLTQSTVSLNIQSLEEALGAQLFLRGSRKKVELTEAGKQAYAAAKDILHRCQSLQARLEELEEGQGRLLTVAASTVPAQYLLPGLLARFFANYGDFRFLLKRGDSAAVYNMLRSGEAQVGFVGAVQEQKDLACHPVLEDRLVLVTTSTSASVPPSGESVLPWLLRQPFVAREEDSGTWQETVRWLRQRGYAAESLRIIARMENPEAICRAVAQGMGVSILSSLAVEEAVAEGRLHQWELGETPACRSICLVYARDTAKVQPQRAFIEFVRKEYH